MKEDVWFHLHDILEKTTLEEQQADQWLVGTRVGEGLTTKEQENLWGDDTGSVFWSWWIHKLYAFANIHWTVHEKAKMCISCIFSVSFFLGWGE